MRDRDLRASRRRIFRPGPDLRLTELRESVPARARRGLTEVREALDPGVPFREARVSGNTIQGVAVLTPRSVNGGPEGRQYLEAARQDGARLINEGTVQAFLDHGKGERSVRDLAGTYQRGRVDGDGVLRADLKVLETPFRATLLDAAQEQPEALALSIDARGSAKMQDGVQIVESIKALRSVDVVATPASTSSLFEALKESRREGGRQTFRAVTGEVLGRASWQLFS